MNAPLFSTITLIMELAVASLIFWVIYRSAKTGLFPGRAALFAVAYEILLNVGYMVYRVIAYPASYSSPAIRAIGMVHGILSLVMMHALMLLFLAAWRSYRKGNNFFLIRRALTGTFIFFWAVSLLSGLALYFRIYF